jgi:hypothetical protein
VVPASFCKAGLKAIASLSPLAIHH